MKKIYRERRIISWIKKKEEKNERKKGKEKRRESEKKFEKTKENVEIFSFPFFYLHIMANSGGIVYLSIAGPLVLLMSIVGIFLLYGGSLRQKCFLSIAAKILVNTSTVVCIWIFYGYSLIYAEADGERNPYFVDQYSFYSDCSYCGLLNLNNIVDATQCLYALTFAILTANIIIGSYIDRLNLPASTLFTLIWLTIVYIPVGRMVWGSGGLIKNGMGVIDVGKILHECLFCTLTRHSLTLFLFL